MQTDAGRDLGGVCLLGREVSDGVDAFRLALPVVTVRRRTI
ncbi:hypothetical protein [Streptomyces sp. WAC 01325]|nr:hypothetical protein [Streptomyces sp. WAC 01325]